MLDKHSIERLAFKFAFDEYCKIETPFDEEELEKLTQEYIKAINEYLKEIEKEKVS